MLLQNCSSFFLVSNVWLALLAVIICKRASAPPIEPVDQIQNGISGEGCTQNFQSAEPHFLNVSPWGRRMKLVNFSKFPRPLVEGKNLLPLTLELALLNNEQGEGCKNKFPKFTRDMLPGLGKLLLKCI